MLGFVTRFYFCNFVKPSQSYTYKMMGDTVNIREDRCLY